VHGTYVHTYLPTWVSAWGFASQPCALIPAWKSLSRPKLKLVEPQENFFFLIGDGEKEVPYRSCVKLGTYIK
jgi:hypothetical protein